MNYQDVVAEFERRSEVINDHLWYVDPDDVTELVTQLVKEVEAGEQDRILQELKDETNNWEETVGYYTIEGIVKNWRDYEKVYHDDPTSDSPDRPLNHERE